MANYVPWLYRKCYHTGYRWCSRCGKFRAGRVDRPGYCEDCNTRLRSRAKGSPAKRLREPYTVRF